MNSFLCLFVPSIISIKMYQHFNHDELLWKELVLNYFLFVFFNHFFSVFVSIFLFGARSSVMNSVDFFPVFALKYCIISIIICIVLPILFQILKQNVDYRVEVIKNEKGEKKCKKRH